MDFVASAIIGYFFGFMLGVGCALAVLYSIYNGGYDKALRDSLLPVQPERYASRLIKARLRGNRASRSSAEPTPPSVDSSV